MNWWQAILIAVVGYFLGNFSTGLIVGKRVAHIDIREHGSGNAGTTNILRTLGWSSSAMTFAGDVLKAVVASLIGLWIGGRAGAHVGGVAAVVGHNWPVLFGFKGGKGMAASCGAILVSDPLIALILVACQVIVLAVTKYMSVASIASAILYIVVTLILRFGQWDRIVFALILSALALYSHRSNIQRLLKGRENRLDFAKISKLTKKQ